MTINQKPLLLLVDDHTLNIQILHKILSKDGYKFAVAEDGRGVFEVVKDLKPDLILLDIMLPDMDGFEICRRLKKSEKTSDIPIIFLTAKSEPEDKVRGFELGAVDYITKPFDQSEVRARVKNHLALKRHEDLIKKYAIELEYESEKIRTLLDNTSHGFLSFGKDLIIENEYSLECERIFKKHVGGLDFAELIYPDDAHKQLFLKNILHDILTDDNKERVDLYHELVPKEFKLNEKYIEVKYKVIYDTLLEDNKIVAVITDKTDTVNLENKIEEERNILRMVVKSVTNYNDVIEICSEFDLFFNRDFKSIIEKDISEEEKILELFRKIHTFKGLFSQMDMLNTVFVLNSIEHKLSVIKEENPSQVLEEISKLFHNKKPAEFLKKDLDLIKGILGNHFFDKKGVLYVDSEEIGKIENKMMLLLSPAERNMLLPSIKKLRYRSFKDLLKNYPDYVRKLAQNNDKKIAHVAIEGDDILVNPEFYDSFIKTLVHVFRNSVFHGIEPSVERLSSDKDAEGSVMCYINFKNNEIVLEIADDGRGIDVGLLRTKAIEAGIYDKNKAYSVSENEIINLIFYDRITTSEETSKETGRGIGLAAVMQELKKINGKVEVRTKTGEGTSFTFKLPVHNDEELQNIPINNILNSIIKNVIDYIEEELKLNIEFSADIINSESVELKDYTSFQELKGIVNGIFVISFDKNIGETIVRKTKDLDNIEYVLNKVSEKILKYSIEKSDKLKDIVKMGTLYSVTAVRSTLSNKKKKIWFGKMESELGDITVSFFEK